VADHSASSGADRFRAAAESGDGAGLLATLAPDVTFNSPVAFRPFQGSDAVGQVLAAVSETFEDFRYTDQLEGETAHALVFKARVDDKEIEGVDLLRLDPEGRVRELTVLVRPMSAMVALAQAMGPKVAHLKGAPAAPR
jgi:hypothetical protein